MTISERLKAARDVLALKQAEFATKSGCSPSTYQKYEQGSSVPGGEAIAGMIRLGINANWLLTGEGPMLLSELRASAAAGFDLARFRLAIEATEEGLTAAGRVMAPNKKAELVLAVYELFAEPANTKERILKLVKLAA